METNEFKDKLAAGSLTRREMQTTLAAAGLAAVTMPLVSRGASAAEEAIYFTWSGYDIPELFPAYIEKYGQPPETPLFADNEETFVKMKSGFQVDAAHPCSFHTGRWRDAGIIQPIDTTRLSNWDNVFPDLKTLETTQLDGEQWFIPFDCGQSNMKAFEAVDEDVLVARGLSKDPLALLEAGVFIPSASPEINTKIERDWSEITAGF